MVGRLNRPAPLQEVAQPRVADSNLQRAFDALATPLAMVVAFLRPFVQPEPWQKVTYRTGWVDFSVVQFRKSAMKTVQLRGAAQRTSGSDTVIFVLPIGYRPAQRLFFPGINLSGAVYTASRIDVDVDGRVLVASGPTDFVMLDHIRFEVP